MTATTRPHRPTSRRPLARIAIALATAAGLTYAGTSAAQRPAAAGTFEIRLHRPETAGSRRHVEVHATKHQQMQLVAGTRVLRNNTEDTRSTFLAVERVVTVTPNGKALQSEYTIEQFDTDDAQGHHSLLHRGQVVVVTRADTNAGATVTIDNAPASREMRSALDGVLSFTARAATDDDMFGTTQRQRVGGSWAMNSAAAERDLRESTGIEASLHGSTRLARHFDFHGTDALEVTSQMNGNVRTLPGMPSGATVRSGALTARMSATLPVATTGSGLTQHMEMTMNMVVDIPAQGNGPASQLRMTANETKDESATPM